MENKPLRGALAKRNKIDYSRVDCDKYVHRHLRALWSNIKCRCLNPLVSSYKDYGGRGSAIYEPWLDPYNFVADILAEIGPRPKDLSLDRINNDGNYEPGNIRWATQKVQVNNSRPAIARQIRTKQSTFE